MSDWRPIESAPRDQTVLIVVEAKESHPWLAGKPAQVHPAYVDEDGRLCDCGTWRPELGFEGPNFRSTHWMPLPAPPPGPEGVSAGQLREAK